MPHFNAVHHNIPLSMVLLEITMDKYLDIIVYTIFLHREQNLLMHSHTTHLAILKPQNSN